ncbi:MULTISPECIES: HEPN domain-containing protein [Halocynthiibacter]|uniref:HEPN domain-containing protein n=1 Tax=Halocynthiibacter halioticoli TaxID=2986804 RepID=A0AAE3IY91_9RHOB|nr:MULTISPECIES: HEPN domain-containing protein [Halocynthiibacter]MCV6823954.1 HEPN domain-containing protein [Halocynthiibacter halioticoli]MCW4056955.1 HEPN domain-containing protein [Halocynthiibacter sp. SDUM655004]
MANEDKYSAVGLFNYAHSYAASAIELEGSSIDATHPDAVVYYLYFHAIELYLKSYLLAYGNTAEQLRQKYGHNVRKLANACAALGLTLEDGDVQVIDLMKETDNVISSRYLRTGHHTRLPFIAFQETCYRLHEQICTKAYEKVGGQRRPVLRISKKNTLIRPHADH